MNLSNMNNKNFNALDKLDKLDPATLFYMNVYKILMKHAGANEKRPLNYETYSFVSAHIEEDPCREWRFQGYLGFGGKYISSRNVVTCYPEDLNVKTAKIIKTTNKKLKELYDEFITIKELAGDIQKIELKKVADELKLV